jgi:hypothetical protein
MTVEIKPETERLVREEIQRGHVRSVDELIELAVQALREKHPVEPSTADAPPRKPRRNLADFLLESPFAGSELDLERQKDYPRDIEL